MAITKVSPGLLDLDSGITISTTDNTTQLTLLSTDADAAIGPVLDLYRNSSSPADSDSLGMLRFKANNDANEETIVANIKATVVDVSDGSEDGRLLLQTMIDGTNRNRIEITNTEVVVNQSSVDSDFRVESNGNTHMFFVDGGNNNVLIGNTVVNPASGFSAQAGFGYSSTGQVQIAATSNLATLVLGQNQGTNGSILDFRKQGTNVGTISVTGSATAYNTSSDARLKEVTGSARGLEVINELNPVAYNWKSSGQADEGLIAQEVLDIIPNAVSGSEEDMYQMDYSKLVAHLVAGMKEQQTQIEALESQINLLKGE